MERKKKVEMFEQIRREYEFGNRSIRAIAKKYGIHRRMVRQALENAMPPERKKAERKQVKMGAIAGYIDKIIVGDRNSPRKQRHTARRIYELVKAEGWEISESSVRKYVRRRKEEMGMGREHKCVPQCYRYGEEAQVDWYEAYAEIGGRMEKVYVFCMRSMASGGAFHRAYPRATQQAFFEGHEKGFEYFGGVFEKIRYDNLSSAVKKVMWGRQREEQISFIAFRSHWRFNADFCNPGQGNEKGGVEGEVGYFRRNHWVPIPVVGTMAELNEKLLMGCKLDQKRIIGSRKEDVGSLMVKEQERLLKLVEEGFEIAEVRVGVVDNKGCVKVANNFYSVPLKTRQKVTLRLLPMVLEVWQEGKLLTCHERCYGRHEYILELEHYLDVLAHKPGALAGSQPLAQWRARGRWPEEFEQLWQDLQVRWGKQAGTKQMIELLELGRQYGYKQLQNAIVKASSLGCRDAAAIKHLISSPSLSHAQVELIDTGLLSKYQRALPPINNYDQLLEVV